MTANNSPRENPPDGQAHDEAASISQRLTKADKERLNSEYELLAADLRKVYGREAQSVVIHCHTERRGGRMTIGMTVVNYHGHVLSPQRATPDAFTLLDRTHALLGSGHWKLPRGTTSQNASAQPVSSTRAKTASGQGVSRHVSRHAAHDGLPSAAPSAATGTRSSGARRQNRTTDLTAQNQNAPVPNTQPVQNAPSAPTQAAPPFPPPARSNTRNREALFAKIGRDGAAAAALPTTPQSGAATSETSQNDHPAKSGSKGERTL